MRPKRTNERARRILTAAREEFAERGFAGSRIDRIARKAAVNKQLLFYYFNSKRGLFQAVLADCAGELDAILAPAIAASSPSSSALVRLRQMLEAQYDFLARNAALVGLLTQSATSEARPLAPAINRLVVLLAEGQGLGEVRDDVDPHLTAALALVLMLAYLDLEPLIAASAGPLRIDGPALLLRWKDAAIRLVLDGVAAHPRERA